MQTSAPAAPSDSSWKVYAKAGGIYARSSNAEVGPFGAASGAATFGGARVYNSAVQALADSTDVKITFDSERFDTAAYHSTSVNTSRLTVPSTGYYHIGAHIAFAANNSGYRQMYLLVNNTTAIAIVRHQAATGSTSTRMSISTIYALTANDYVEIVAAQNSGGSLNTEQGANWAPEFWIQYLGA